MFQGSIVAMVTPMFADGAIDDESLARLVEFHVESGTDAIVAVGTTGESATLDHEEHIRLIARVIELADGRLPIIGGTGANSTSEALHLTQEAKRVGADGCLLVTPYYNKPTQHGLYEHYRIVAEEVDIPQILYNVPGRTACDMLPDTVARLAELPNIVGIKEATGSLERIHELKSGCPDDFVILSGEDWMGLDTILAGGRGVISVTANVAPALMHEMCERALNGQVDEARECDDRLQPLHKGLFLESNPIPSKWALKEMGLIGEGIRLPLTWLSEQYHDEVRLAMATANAVPA